MELSTLLNAVAGIGFPAVVAIALLYMFFTTLSDLREDIIAQNTRIIEQNERIISLVEQQTALLGRQLRILSWLAGRERNGRGQRHFPPGVDNGEGS